jgi:hypothetical protein
MDNTNTISVIDFRRRGVVLQWHSLGGTWTACELPPSLVHGIAMIRPTGPNICIYGQEGRLRLQVGPNSYALAENSPRLSCTRGVASFGFRRRFTVKSSAGGVLFSHSYWTGQGRDFYRWLSDKAADPDWRVASGRQWSEGVTSSALRLG